MSTIMIYLEVPSAAGRQEGLGGVDNMPSQPRSCLDSFPLVHRMLKQLRILTLNKGKFDDEGLRVLNGLTKLRSLELRFCNGITMAGLGDVVVPLSQQSLAFVDVTGCQNIPVQSAFDLVILMQRCSACT